MSIDYTPSDTFLVMTGKNISHSFAGLIAGIIVNRLGVAVYERLGITDKNVRIAGQIVLCSVLLAYIHTRVNNQMGWEWQNVTPGIFFISFFFGVQYLSFTSIQEVYGVKRL